MKLPFFVIAVAAGFLALRVFGTGEDCVKRYLKHLDQKLHRASRKLALAEWNSMRDNTEENWQRVLAVLKEIRVQKIQNKGVLEQMDWKRFKDPDVVRQIKMFLHLEDEVLPAEKYEELQGIIASMKASYNNINFPEFNNPELNMNNFEIPRKFVYCWNFAELKEIFVSFRHGLGPSIRPKYPRYVELKNEAARLNGFRDASEMWLALYEVEDIRRQVDRVVEQIRPFYQQLHAFTRFRMRAVIGPIIGANGTIPMHLLNSICGDSWQWVAPGILPFKQRLDYVLEESHCNRLDLYQSVERWFKAMSLREMPVLLWNNSIFERTMGATPICHPVSLNLQIGNDYRIVDCVSARNLGSLYTAVRLLASVENMILHQGLPAIYNYKESNIFWCALGNVVILSQFSLDIFNEIFSGNAMDSLDFLYYKALVSIPNLPFIYILDLWRWNIFSGEIKQDNYNCKWWDLVHKYQGIQPPMDRSESDFDAAAEVHVSADIKYIDCFVGQVMSYQLYRGLCIKVGEYDPDDSSKLLHQCNLTGKLEGGILTDALKFGLSKPWYYPLEVLTGSNQLDAGALLEYFDPLMKRLEQENAINNQLIGWEASNKICKGYFVLSMIFLRSIEIETAVPSYLKI